MTIQVGYARSTTVSSASITEQLRAIRERSATIHEAVFGADRTEKPDLSELFIDMGVDGSVPLDERRGGAELLEFCEAHPQEAIRPGVVIVQEFGCFSEQEPPTLLGLWTKLAGLGWLVIDTDGRDLSMEALEQHFPELRELHEELYGSGASLSEATT